METATLWEIKVWVCIAGERKEKIFLMELGKDNEQDFSSILICSTYFSYCEGIAAQADFEKNKIS